MNEIVYKSPANSIIKEMQSVLPQGWTKVCFCFEMEEKAYSGDFFVFIGHDTTPQRSINILKEYSLSEDLISSFYNKVYNLLLPIWKKTEKKGGAFSHYILTFDENHFEEEYDYRILSDSFGFFDFWAEWKKTYVKA